MKNYIVELCPHCNEISYVNNGNIEDLTISDIEAIKCWKCKRTWLIEGAREWTTLEDANTTEGHPVLQ